MLDWGDPDIIALFQRREARGDPSPSWDNRPRLWFISALPYQLFLAMHKSRPVGFGPTPLPVSDVVAYLGMYDFSRGEARDLFEMILALDSEWIDWARSSKK